MCGRYTQTASLKELRERFSISASEIEELAPRYNIAPTQDAPVVVLEEGGRALKAFRWGLIPFWAKDPAIGHKLINARAETAAEKPSFRKPFAARRCLVLADGFYEWRRTGPAKTPLRAALPSRAPFALAGLWDLWKSPEGELVRTFTILTTSPNETMRPLHDRMPVILAKEAEGAWLDPKTPPRDLAGLLAPWSGPLEVYEVSALVNSPRNEAPACAEPIGPPFEPPLRSAKRSIDARRSE